MQLHFFALCFATIIYAQDFYQDQRAGWLQKAAQTQPKLIETIKQPVLLVALVKDETIFQQ